ncbi:MAG: 23S rRNA (uracil(1939)-C(5))-methyltransferase RlmD [Oscillospiraceae bacterium]|nr:23S rRNA (uracil(1939)-C(5))-methyltransferase RlmD [Oscillospiraceae bacterium]
MILKKNEICEITITGVTNEGNGVGRYENMAVFVPFTAVGDVIECKIVKVKKSYAYGIVNKILKPSDKRCESNCDVFKKCGGCAFCHFEYEEELRVKQDFVKASFERIGKLDVKWEEILGAEKLTGYRNKAMYPVGTNDNGELVCGFYSRRSHRVVEYLDCNLQPDIFKSILVDVLKWCNENKVTAYDEVTHKGLLRHIYLRKGEYSDEIMVCLVVTDLNFDFSQLVTKLKDCYPNITNISLNYNKNYTNVILGNECKTLYGKDFLTDYMCGETFQISPLSFYQVNTKQAEKLYEIAKEYADLKEGEFLLDLYCGVGTIGLSVCGENRLLGVGIIPQAIENAKINAKLNNKENCEFICGDAGEIADRLLKRGENPDVIIADPARKGCDNLSLESMVKMSPKRIVMISCNHATAARDCAYLCEKGYEIVKGRAVDLFPRTTHVECVLLLEKR